MVRERQLIDAAKTGSVTAFTDLVGGYREGLFRFLLSRCNNHADAEDALQDTLINAYKYIHSYNPKWRFSTWLYRIAIRNAMKRNQRVEVTELTDVGSDDHNPLRQAMADSERVNLWASARRVLSDEVYAALWLRYVEDMPVKDIATTLERTVSWTKVNLLRARKTLDATLRETQSEAYG